jgi:hypothetical protein
MAAPGFDRIRVALLLAYLYGVLGAGTGIALAPFFQRGLPGDGAPGVASLVLLAVATASFALEVTLFLGVIMLPAAIVTLPLTYAAARWVAVPRWGATLLGTAFAVCVAWPRGAVTVGGDWILLGQDHVAAAALGGACFAQPIWRRCMRPRMKVAATGVS